MRNFALLSLVCLSSQISAQKSLFGLTLGLSSSYQKEVITSYGSYYGYSGNTARITQPTLGFFYQLSFAEKISLRVNTQLMVMGEDSDQLVRDEMDIVYLTIPVTMRIEMAKRFYFHGGTYGSWFLSGRSTTQTNGYYTKQIDADKTYNKTDFGLVGGFEYDLSRRWAINARYFLGLPNVWTNDKDYNGTYKAYNRSVQLAMIYKFKEF